VYISGHGGNEFMKFQDVEELMAQVGLALRQQQRQQQQQRRRQQQLQQSGVAP
jgi:glycosylphosphatidylinositol transamidase (GPIT) subunit GPI8